MPNNCILYMWKIKINCETNFSVQLTQLDMCGLFVYACSVFESTEHHTKCVCPLKKIQSPHKSFKSILLWMALNISMSHFRNVWPFYLKWCHTKRYQLLCCMCMHTYGREMLGMFVVLALKRNKWMNAISKAVKFKRIRLPADRMNGAGERVSGWERERGETEKQIESEKFKSIFIALRWIVMVICPKPLFNGKRPGTKYTRISLYP